MSDIIFTHGDTDGICAATLAYARYPDAKIWFTHPAGFYNDIKGTKADHIVICDIAISERDKARIFEELRRLTSEGEVTYIDHHPLPLETISADVPATHVVRDKTRSASEQAYAFFKEHLDPELNRVALFGAISDYCDETAFVREELNFYDKRTIYMEASLLSQCLGESRRDYKLKKRIIEALVSNTMPSAMEDVVKKAIKATKKEWRAYERTTKNVEVMGNIAVVNNIPKGVSAAKSAKFAIGITGAEVALGVKFRDENANISARKHTDSPVDLDRTLRIIAPRFGGSGGGHPSAAGARVPRKALDDFLNVLSKEVSAVI